jgi:hypothetical protein
MSYLLIALDFVVSVAPWIMPFSILPFSSINELVDEERQKKFHLNPFFIGM